MVGSIQSQVKSQVPCARDGYKIASSLKIIMKDTGNLLLDPPSRKALMSKLLEVLLVVDWKALSPKGTTSPAKALEGGGISMTAQGVGSKGLAVSKKLRIRFSNCQQTFHSKSLKLGNQCGYFEIICWSHNTYLVFQYLGGAEDYNTCFKWNVAH